jgi:hypothetical protein
LEAGQSFAITYHVPTLFTILAAEQVASAQVAIVVDLWGEWLKKV